MTSQWLSTLAFAACASTTTGLAAQNTVFDIGAGQNFVVRQASNDVLLQLAPNSAHQVPNYAWQITNEIRTKDGNDLVLGATGAYADIYLKANGSIALSTPYVWANVHAPAGSVMSFLGRGNVPTLTLPNDTSLEYWPNNAITLTAFVTGNNDGHLRMRHRTANSSWFFYDAAYENTLIQLTNNGYLGLGVNGAPQHKLHLGGGAYSDGASWVNASSREYKKDIKPLEDPLELVEKVNVYRYKYRPGHGDIRTERIGVIAEELPAEVASADGKGAPTGELIALSLGATKDLARKYRELDAINREQRARIQALEERMEILLDRLAAAPAAGAGKRSAPVTPPTAPNNLPSRTTDR